MISTQAKMIKTFQQQGYMVFCSPGVDPVEPESRELVSHDQGVVIGPEAEMVPFKELLGAGALMDDRYHEGSVALLGKIVANRTQGRFPERWVGVSTGDRLADQATVSRISSYVLGTFPHLLDPNDIAVLESDAPRLKGDLLRTAHLLDRCLGEIAESEVHPLLSLWRQNVRSVVENFVRGVHVARVNQPLRYDDGSTLAFLADVAPAAGVYIGTRHGISFPDIRKGLGMGERLEAYLNLVGTKEGSWLRVYQGQPFKATPGVVAELVMRDGQKSAKLLGGNVDLALTDDAVVGPEKVKRQIVGPTGPVTGSHRTWRMRAGRLFLCGVEFVDKSAEPFEHTAKDKYRHVRAMDGAVTLIVGDNRAELQVGESALVLPGAGFMVGILQDQIPSSYVVSTLTDLGSASRAGGHG